MLLLRRFSIFPHPYFEKTKAVLDAFCVYKKFKQVNQNVLIFLFFNCIFLFFFRWLVQQRPRSNLLLLLCLNRARQICSLQMSLTCQLWLKMQGKLVNTIANYPLMQTLLPSQYKQPHQLQWGSVTSVISSQNSKPRDEQRKFV